jgi:hypothetical protein
VRTVLLNHLVLSEAWTVASPAMLVDKLPAEVRSIYPANIGSSSKLKAFRLFFVGNDDHTSLWRSNSGYDVHNSKSEALSNPLPDRYQVMSICADLCQMRYRPAFDDSAVSPVAESWTQ